MMVQRAVMMAVLLITAAACAQQPDLVQGNWVGAFTSGNLDQSPIRAEIVGEARGYRAHVYLGEAPGTRVARWIAGTGRGRKIVFSGNADLASVTGAPKTSAPTPITMTWAGGELKGKFAGSKSAGSFKLARVEKKSPTLGAQPPAGSVVLFDGKNLDAWQPAERAWTITPEGAVQVGKGALRSKEELGSGLYHVEFRTPYMRDKKGQARGNSGVYLLGRYEVQVLDSFGLELHDNECGGIYKMAVPKVNACLPPTEWQTYDIDFVAPEFDAQGNKTKNAVITLKHNGVAIHDKVEITGVTAGSVSEQEAVKGILFLQDHGNRVEYRNIWFKAF